MDPKPLLVRNVLRVQRVPADPGRAHEHVQARQPLDRRVQLARVAYVVAVREVENVHVCSTVAEPFDDGRSDAARSAGDERGPSLEVVVVAHSAFLYGFRDVVRRTSGLPAG